MKKLWDYEDYVNHLSHANKLVRRWAFNALENHFSNKYTDKISILINDEDEHLACSALRYLARHEAVQHAPAILEHFKRSQGMISGNCASTLAKMQYEPAIDVMLENFLDPGSEEKLLGILDYLGEIQLENSREALRSAVSQMKDTFLLGTAMANVLHHHHPEDVNLVIDRYIESGDRNNSNDMLLRNLSHAWGGGTFFKNLTEYGQNNILAKPKEAMDNLGLKNSQIALDASLRENMIRLLENGQYVDFLAMIQFDARKIVHARYPNNHYPDGASALFDQDTICINILEDLLKRSSVWTQVKHSDALGKDLIALAISAYFSLKERNAYLKALHPGAGVEELIQALKDTGSIFPVPIRKKIKALAPISELKAALTKDLITWGDIWTVQMMGQIGSQDFIPDLIRVLQDSDSLDYIYDDALRAMNALDESANERILTAIENREIGDWQSFAILEHLPYTEAYDLAVHRWESENDNEMDSYEMFASCLLGIGDPRGIEKFQDIYAGENDASYIGDSLECLSKIHGVDIPELPDILQRRKERDAEQKARMKRLNKLTKGVSEKKVQGLFENSGTVVPFKRDTPKVGRNAPCPCGSGKKYKKCCLNKNR